MLSGMTNCRKPLNSCQNGSLTEKLGMQTVESQDRFPLFAYSLSFESIGRSVYFV